MKEILQPSSDVATFHRQGFQWSVSHKAHQGLDKALSYKVLLNSALDSHLAIVSFPNVQLACKQRGQAFIEGEGEVMITIIMGERPISQEGSMGGGQPLPKQGDPKKNKPTTLDDSF